MTDYCEGDLHAHIEHPLHALRPGPDPAVVRETLDTCLPRTAWDTYGSRTRKALEQLFPVPQPRPAPRYTDLTAAQQQLLHDLVGHRHARLIRPSAHPPTG
ncbi:MULTISPECIES: hypothetical protein [unclassified Streptomyces]|uniref:hypothetical protein n=1 Tax=unclassified Streptomyces TaxID=2593676 RepID=UPI0037FB24CD